MANNNVPALFDRTSIAKQLNTELTKREAKPIRAAVIEEQTDAMLHAMHVHNAAFVTQVAMIELDSVLGFHPSARGFGWALFEGKPILIDFGAPEISGTGKNEQVLKQIEALLAKWRPHVLAIEDFEDPSSRRHARVKQLYRGVLALAKARGIEIARIKRAGIASAMANDPDGTRHAIAMAVADRVDVLRPRLPAKQKIWLGEGHNMGLFCAAACGLAYYARNAASNDRKI